MQPDIQKRYEKNEALTNILITIHSKLEKATRGINSWNNGINSSPTVLISQTIVYEVKQHTKWLLPNL
jgi:hypothetical protein